MIVREIRALDEVGTLVNGCRGETARVANAGSRAAWRNELYRLLDGRRVSLMDCDEALKRDTSMVFILKSMANSGVSPFQHLVGD